MRAVLCCAAGRRGRRTGAGAAGGGGAAPPTHRPAGSDQVHRLPRLRARGEPPAAFVLSGDGRLPRPTGRARHAAGTVWGRACMLTTPCPCCCCLVAGPPRQPHPEALEPQPLRVLPALRGKPASLLTAWQPPNGMAAAGLNCQGSPCPARWPRGSSCVCPPPASLDCRLACSRPHRRSRRAARAARSRLRAASAPSTGWRPSGGCARPGPWLEGPGGSACVHRAVLWTAHLALLPRRPAAVCSASHPMPRPAPTSMRSARRFWRWCERTPTSCRTPRCLPLQPAPCQHLVHAIGDLPFLPRPSPLPRAPATIQCPLLSSPFLHSLHMHRPPSPCLSARARRQTRMCSSAWRSSGAAPASGCAGEAAGG